MIDSIADITRRSRPAVQAQRVLHDLRRRIIDGTYAPGGRLPTRLELEREFEVSLGTVQRAFEFLAEDGFIRAQGRDGTFVVDHPPHLARYGLVLPSYASAARQYWSQHWIAMADQAAAIERESDRRVPLLFSAHGRGDMPEFKQIIREIRHQRLAGLIFVPIPSELRNTPILDLPNTPRVVVGNEPFDGIPAVATDQSQLMAAMVEALVARGKRRIVVVAYPAPSPFTGWGQALRNAGLELKSYSIQPTTTDTVSSTCHLLMQLKGEDRPDGLIIADDNLITGAISGLVAAGVRGPADLEIVAHTNFPCPVASALPVTRVGFDCGAVLRRCIEIIDQQRRGETPAPVTSVPATTEHALASLSAPMGSLS